MATSMLGDTSPACHSSPSDFNVSAFEIFETLLVFVELVVMLGGDAGQKRVIFGQCVDGLFKPQGRLMKGFDHCGHGALELVCVAVLAVLVSSYTPQVSTRSCHCGSSDDDSGGVGGCCDTLKIFSSAKRRAQLVVSAL